MHHTKDRIAPTTAFVTPVVEHWLEQEILNGSNMKDRSSDPLHQEQTLLPQSYILFPIQVYYHSEYIVFHIATSVIMHVSKIVT